MTDPVPDEVKAAIAEAVHRAVCGVVAAPERHCHLYTLAGYAALKLATGLDYAPQAGSLRLLIDPPTGVFAIDATDGGVDRQEFHAWLARPDHADPTRSRPAELVDFAARHYRVLAERSMLISDAVDLGGIIAVTVADPADRIPWRIPNPPPFLWGAPEQLPDWVLGLVAERDACTTLMAIAVADGGRARRVCGAVGDQLAVDPVTRAYITATRGRTPTTEETTS